MPDRTMTDRTPDDALTDDARPDATGPAGAAPDTAEPDRPSICGRPRTIALALVAFVAAFLLGGWLTGTIGRLGWGPSLGMAAALGIAGAGLQLLLLAVRQRGQLEGPAA